LVNEKPDVSVAPPGVDKRLTVNDAFQLDVHLLRHRGRFAIGKNDTGQITWQDGDHFIARLACRIEEGAVVHFSDVEGAITVQDFSVDLTSSKRHFGGRRYYFVCPNCERRSQILYCPLDTDSFWCRICHNLTYEIQQRHRDKLFEGLWHRRTVDQGGEGPR